MEALTADPRTDNGTDEAQRLVKETHPTVATVLESFDSIMSLDPNLVISRRLY
jgi:hypothetical protein